VLTPSQAGGWSHPNAGLIIDSAAISMAPPTRVALHYGTVFELDSAGNETVLYSFYRLRDGAIPLAGVVRDSAGNLTAPPALAAPSAVAPCTSWNSSGIETVLHSFNGGTDGAIQRELTLGCSRQNLFGTSTRPRPVKVCISADTLQ